MSSSSRGFLARPAALGLPLVAVGLVLALTGDLDRHPVQTLSLLAAGFLWQALAARRLERAGRPCARGILLVALLFRLPLLALPPTLSDDVLRYLWDGRVAAAGLDPYRLAPDAAALEPLRDELWRRLPHRDVATVYPPLAVGLFSIAARAPWPLAALKGALTAADLATCWLLVALLRRRGLPEARAAWYAWSPLAALETAGMGHVDALGVAAAVAAVLALSRRGDESAPAGRRGEDETGTAPRDGGRAGAPAAAGVAGLRTVALAGLAAAGGVLVKLLPLAALPLWARRSGRPALFAAVALGAVAAGLAPAAAGGVPPGLVTYGVSWEFNGPLYEPLWRAIDAAGVDRAIHRGLDRLEAETGRWSAADPLYPLVYPQLLARLLLALGAAWAVWRSIGARDAVAGTRSLFGALLLVSPTVYPWYVLWVLPFAAAERTPAWLALAALSPLAYLPRMIPGASPWPWVWAAIWVPFAAVLLRGGLAARQTRRSGGGSPA